MEPTTSTATLQPAAAPAPAQHVLPRPVLWIAVAIAAALPVILLVTLFVVMIATQYNFLNWME